MTEAICRCGHSMTLHICNIGDCIGSHDCACRQFVLRPPTPARIVTLAGIMRDQRTLQRRIKKNLGQKVWHLSEDDMEDCTRFTAIAIADEAHELLHTTRWKPWRKQEFDYVEAKKELTDILIFCLNGFNDLGVDAEQVAELFYDKLHINNARQDKLEEGDPV